MEYNIWNIDDNNFPKKGNKAEKINFLLKYAILAPSSHNMQPWLFKVEDNIVDVCLNPQRKLLFSDRTNRQAYLSVGCAIANLLLASEHFGVNYKIEYLPENPFEEVVARITFGDYGVRLDLKKYSNLFNFIVERKTNRFPHLNKDIPDDVLKNIAKIGNQFGVKVDCFSKNEVKDQLAKIIGDASFAAFSNEFFKRELSEWVISTYSKRHDGIPLYDFGIPHPLTIFAKYMIRMMPANTQRKLDIYNLQKTSSVLLMSIKTDLKKDWISAGIGIQLIWLYLTKEKISLAPMGAPIEHPETRNIIRNQFAESYYPVFCARMGYSIRKTRSSPRRPVGDVVV